MVVRCVHSAAGSGISSRPTATGAPAGQRRPLAESTRPAAETGPAWAQVAQSARVAASDVRAWGLRIQSGANMADCAAAAGGWGVLRTLRKSVRIQPVSGRRWRGQRLGHPGCHRSAQAVSAVGAPAHSGPCHQCTGVGAVSEVFGRSVSKDGRQLAWCTAESQPILNVSQIQASLIIVFLSFFFCGSGLEKENVAVPTAQTLLAVASIEQLLQTKLQPPELKEVASNALIAIRDPATSLENLVEVFASVAQKLYHNLILW